MIINEKGRLSRQLLSTINRSKLWYIFSTESMMDKIRIDYQTGRIFSIGTGFLKNPVKLFV